MEEPTPIPVLYNGAASVVAVLPDHLPAELVDFFSDLFG